MRSQNRARIFWFKGIFRLCVCLVVVGIVILGAAERTAAATATGSPPEIKVFTADPLILPDGGSATYTFEVWNATNIKLIEAGELLKEINGPPLTTYKGKATGRTTYKIRLRSMDSFDATLVASNAGGQKEQKLSIAFATKVKPRPVPPNKKPGTDARTPKWGPQTSKPASSTTPAKSTLLPWPDEFFKCSGDCKYCLKPDDAAQLGYTQKCSEQLCLYSQDNQQKWYCYSEPKGYCCKEGPAGQEGQVTDATKSECTASGGDYWSLDRNEAVQACQATGYCCRDGQIGGPMTENQCTAAGGSIWSPDRAEVIQKCEPLGYCCKDGQVGRATQNQCDQMGGSWSTNQSQAAQACQPCYCCTRATASPVGRNRGEAPGQVTQTTPGACAAQGGTCYNSMQAASQACGAR